MTTTPDETPAAADEAPPPPKTDFRVTTFYKRPRGQAGLTRVDSNRLSLGRALDWLLAELPEDAVVCSGDGATSVTIVIDWTQVPAEIRYGTCGPTGVR